jgi:tetratricopeptide (TPR) repeat protein
VKAISKLKDEARRFEQQEQWENAIAAYQQVLKISEAGEAELELPLYNRVGDLYVRLGRAPDAVLYYEQAADRYADLGLFNNAIALCNKALRYRPDRLEVLRKLGQFSMQQGFLTDATTYYINYAEQQFRAGAQDEALDALEEFAAATTDPEVRELLGRRMQDFGRTDRALKELGIAWQMRRSAGQTDAAAALLEEIRRLDADAAVALETPQPHEQVDESRAEAAPPVVEVEHARPGADASPPVSAAEEFYEEVDDSAEEDTGWSSTPLDGLETSATFEESEYDAVEVEGIETSEIPTDVTVGRLEGLESGFDYDDEETAYKSGLDIEREERTFDYGSVVADDVEGEDSEADLGMSRLPLLEDDDAGSEGTDEDQEADESVPLAEPLPLVGGDIDPVIDVEIEEEPATDFDGSVSLDAAAEPLESEPPAVETIDVVAAEQNEADARQELAAAADGYVDLSDLLSIDTEETTRFRVDELKPTGDEDRDFAELLNQFKAKLLAHLPPDDAAAHYDLGLAFREMGLLDEAITVFQIAARAGHMRLKIFEELGQCFLDKKQYKIAEKVLRRALTLEHKDELELLGVYYHLGRACEALGQIDEARDAYERVLGMDINFQDVTERLSRL